jgi:TRAP-type C4-dicarboxylate transport system substrate-binding protein
MKRVKGFVVAVLAAVLLVFSSAPADAQDKVITWKMAGVWGPGDMAYLPEGFAKMVTERSKGRLKVVTYPSGQLYGNQEIYGALQKGLVELADVATGWWGDTIPIYKFPDMPFFVRDNKEFKTLLDGGLMDLWQKEAQRNGFQTLTLYGMNGLTCFSISPVRTLEDAKGKKWRIHTPQLGQAVKNLGASPVTIGMTEVYQAFERGVIDAGFMGVMPAYSYKWHEVAKYITKLDFAVPPMGVFANKKALDSLPPDLKDIVLKAGEEVTKMGWEAIDGFTKKKWDAFTEEKCTVTIISDSERNRFIAASKANAIWAEEVKKMGPIGTQVLDTYYKVFPDRKPR